MRNMTAIIDLSDEPTEPNCWIEHNTYIIWPFDKRFSA